MQISCVLYSFCCLAFPEKTLCTTRLCQPSTNSAKCHVAAFATPYRLTSRPPRLLLARPGLQVLSFPRPMKTHPGWWYTYPSIWSIIPNINIYIYTVYIYIIGSRPVTMSIFCLAMFQWSTIVIIVPSPIGAWSSHPSGFSCTPCKLAWMLKTQHLSR